MKRNALYVAVVLLGLVSIAVFVKTNFDVSPINSTRLSSLEDLPPTGTGETEVVPSKNTIATAWEWEDEHNQKRMETPSLKKIEQANTNTLFPFTEQSVFKALHAVKLDENGDVIIDNDALIALDLALNHSHLNLDPETLEELQSVIKKRLPGNTGEQIAQIVTDYYQYLGAKNEFNALYESRHNADQTIVDYETQYNELLSLRELYFSAEVAGPLFKTANANAQYMFDIMKLEANTYLSEEEKKLQQAEIIERHTENTVNVDNWNERFQTFSENKEIILRSSLSDDQKHDQITDLILQHFSFQEVDKLSHLELNSF